jgi:hypothetical protein
VSGLGSNDCGQDGGAYTNCPTSKCGYTWSSLTSAASISGPSTTRTVSLNGVSAGSGSIQGGVRDQTRPCGYYYVTPTATVKPRIDSISPSRGIQGGTTSSVTITGAGLAGGTVNAGSGITVTVTSTSSTTLVADFAAASNATPGNHSVTVTAGGQLSNGTNFLIQVPTSLSIVSGTDSSTAEAQCPAPNTSMCGMHRAFTYQIMDQETPPQPIRTGNLQFWDVLQTTSPNNLSISGYNSTCPGNTGPCGVTTGADGTFLEVNLGVCSTVCRVNNVCITGGPTNADQTWHVSVYAIVQHISYYCDHVTVNGQ